MDNLISLIIISACKLSCMALYVEWFLIAQLSPYFSLSLCITIVFLCMILIFIFTFDRSKLGYINHKDIEIVTMLNISNTKTAHHTY
jgi:hypothetical protein